MLNDFLCPKCKGYLRVKDNIIFKVKTSNWDGGLLLLHTELGDYSSDNHPSFRFEPGEQVEFFCPICHHRLKSARHTNLAMVLMRDNVGNEFEVYFSEITGEKSTFKLIGEHAEMFGEDADRYIDFFNLSQLT